MRKVLAESLQLTSGPVPWDASLRYVFAIGLPVCAGLALGAVQIGVTASAGALWAYFGDVNGPVVERFGGMLLGVVLQLIGIVIGYGLAEYPYLGVGAVLVAALIAGWLYDSHPAFENAGRLFVIGLAVGPYLQTFGAVDDGLGVAFLAGGLLAATVTALAAAWRGTENVPAPLWRDGWSRLRSGQTAGLRFAVCLGLTTALALTAAEFAGAQRGYWAALTVLVAMRPDARAGATRVVQRLGGTLLGIVIAWVVVESVSNPWVLAGSVALFAALIRPTGARNYGFAVAMICAVVMVLLDIGFLTRGGDVELLEVRLYDTLIGCGFATVGTLLAYPELWRVRPA